MITRIVYQKARLHRQTNHVLDTRVFGFTSKTNSFETVQTPLEVFEMNFESTWLKILN